MKKKNKIIHFQKIRFLFFFAFYGFLFLFYPGSNDYFHIFAYNRLLFLENNKEYLSKKIEVPYLKNPFLFPNLSAEGIYIVELSSFTPVYKKNEKEKFFPASLTKIITALVVYDIYPLDQVLKIDNPLNEGQIMGLVDGEKITVENLLYGLLIHSANDAAYALASNYGFKKFIALMNDKAKKLSMNNTRFTNPAGFDNNSHFSSPYDMALAARALITNSYLKKIVSIKEITISDIDFKYFHHLINVNQLLGEISGLGGIKTGYTEEAGENLVSFYKNDHHQWIIVIIKSNNRFLETREVINWLNYNVAFLKTERLF